MKAKFVREYFLAKYLLKYHKNYLSKSSTADIAMLKRLIDKYDAPLILSAIDLFVEIADIDKCTINYFSTNAVFERYFSAVIPLRKVIPYKRKLKFYPVNIREEVLKLIWEYEGYAGALYPTQLELDRMPQILKELEKLDAEGSGSKAT